MQNLKAVLSERQRHLKAVLSERGHFFAGHARVYISFDILYRFLSYLGYKVKPHTQSNDQSNLVKAAPPS